MKQVKFYYSEPMQVRKIPVITNENGEVLYIYDKVGITVKKVPRVVVASVYDPKENVMTFGAAICSPKDIFVKKIGRELAEKRARRFPEIRICAIDRKNVSKVSKKYANDLITKHLSHHVHVDI